jgi:hypothetical protein
MTYPSLIVARDEARMRRRRLLGRRNQCSSSPLTVDSGMENRHRNVALCVSSNLSLACWYENVVLFVLFDGVVVTDVVALSSKLRSQRQFFAELTPLAPLLAGRLFLATVMQPRLGWRAAKTRGVTPGLAIPGQPHPNSHPVLAGPARYSTTPPSWPDDLHLCPGAVVRHKDSRMPDLLAYNISPPSRAIRRWFAQSLVLTLTNRAMHRPNLNRQRSATTN